MYHKDDKNCKEMSESHNYKSPDNTYFGVRDEGIRCNGKQIHVGVTWDGWQSSFLI
jgi:hypothetical protein